MTQADSDFDFSTLPAFADFGRVMEAEVYESLPADWVLGLSDVVDSRKAIAAGRYKAVNMAGAAVISAVMNALGGRNHPFVFGGDGAAVAVPGGNREALEDALKATACWVRDELGLELRVAVVPLSDIRAEALDVKVARFNGAGAVDYAMFSGGGLSWAERRMKDGGFQLTVPSEPLRPDLTGLSCRWEPAQSEQGVMLSLIAQPEEGADPKELRAAMAAIVDLAGAEERQGHPVSVKGARFRFPPGGLDYEARAQRKGGLAAAKLQILLECALGWLLFRTGWKLGGFDPDRYRQHVMLNADYRKFDDGLKMTLDCSRDKSRAIAERLEEAKQAGIIRYGLFEQNSALMTCIVPSVSDDRHFHFLDGSAGGYAAAADRMERG